MKSEVSKKLAAAALLLALALVSFFPIAQKMSQPQTFSHAIESLDKKQETVLELTAASTAASAAITLLPGDAATPIAEKLADLSGYFLIVLCAIFLEKYLLTIMAGAAFRVLLPLACVLLAASLFFYRDTLRALSKKLALFGLAVVLIIPTSVWVSDTIEDTYRASIGATIESAKQTTDAIGEATDDNADSDTKTGLSGLFSKVTGGHLLRRDRRRRQAQERAQRFSRGAGCDARHVLPHPRAGARVLRLARQAFPRRGPSRPAPARAGKVSRRQWQ